jgi:L-threonylcarbamoyladenylate synthase
LIKELSVVLRGGGIMAYPTETFYGLGAAWFSRQGVDRIFRLKKRASSKPLPVMASNLEMVQEITGTLPLTFQSLAGEFWPGPLTLVLPAASAVPAVLTGPGRSVAVRIPPARWIRDLLDEMEQPLTATSANISGDKEISDPAEVIRLFDGKTDVIINGGNTPGGAPSTLVELTGSEPRVIREGVIPAAAVFEALKSSEPET